MKRTEIATLCLIALGAFFLGLQLVGSIGDKTQNVYPIVLDDFATFDHKLSDFVSTGVVDQEGDKDVVFTRSKHLYMRAEQWQWYPDIEVSAESDYILHIATRDIQHSFHLETKATGETIDVLIQPGKEYQILLSGLKPGVYAIGCTEYCGIEHNKMRGKLIVRE